MALVTRTVYTPSGHGLFLPNGRPAAGTEVRFLLVEAGTTRPASPFDAITFDRIDPVVSVTLDANGEFSVPLWPNDRGAGVATQYLCHVENGASDFRASLPSSATPITWLDFKLMGAPLTPVETSVLLRHIADHTVHLMPSVSTAGLFPRINSVGTGIEYVAGTSAPSPTVQYTAATDLGGHRMVVLDASGQAIYADNLTPGHAFKVLGMTTGACVAGDLATILPAGGITEVSWSWDVSLPVYLGANGLLTQTMPTAPAFQRIVGFPVTATSMYVSLREPVSLI